MKISQIDETRLSTLGRGLRAMALKYNKITQWVLAAAQSWNKMLFHSQKLTDVDATLKKRFTVSFLHYSKVMEKSLRYLSFFLFLYQRVII